MSDKGTLYVVSAPSGAGKTSLVKALLDQLGGNITLDPGDHGGSRFTVYIPKSSQLQAEDSAV